MDERFEPERPFTEYDYERMQEPPCDWGCVPGSCSHPGTCIGCGATNLPPIPQRCRVCSRPMKLRSVS